MNTMRAIPITDEQHSPFPRRITIVTDAWLPQMNGVVRTLTTTCAILRDRGHEVQVISPDLFASMPCPTYPEIRLAMPRPGAVGAMIAQFGADAVHISTEGPLGLAARRYCLAQDRPFTTAYHTQFPDYVAQRTGLPASWLWRYIQWFHGPAQRIMVATPSIREELAKRGLTRHHHWSRGVDLGCFSPDAPQPLDYVRLPRPIQLYVGRVAVEKNIEAFLANSYPGSKVVVGDGPSLPDLRARFPEAHFLGRKSGRELAGCYAGADVFVFPSRTDTFGLVMIEALACGTPVAGYPVPGPNDIIDPKVGATSQQLDRAIGAALFSDTADCIAHAREYSWDVATDQFLAGLCALSMEELHTQGGGAIANAAATPRLL